MFVYADLTRAYKWQPITHPSLSGVESQAIQKKMLEILTPWLGTKWAPGQFERGVAADCVRTACGWFDQFSGKSRVHLLRRVAQDMPLHSRTLAFAVMKEYLRFYQPLIEVKDRTLEPGDLIAIGRGAKGGPHHAILVGPEPNTFWQTLHQVRKTGMKLVVGFERILRIYRATDKHTWTR